MLFSLSAGALSLFLPGKNGVLLAGIKRIAGGGHRCPGSRHQGRGGRRDLARCILAGRIVARSIVVEPVVAVPIVAIPIFRGLFLAARITGRFAHAGHVANGRLAGAGA